MDRVRDFISNLLGAVYDSLWEVWEGLSGQMAEFELKVKLPAQILVGILIVVGMWIGLDQCSGELNLESPYQIPKE